MAAARGLGRRLLGGALLVLGTLALVAGGAELWVRLVTDDGMRYDLEMWKYARTLKRVAADPAVGHEHVPGAEARLMGVDVRIDRHGFRDQGVEVPKPPGVLRVVVLGDSFTLGWGVEAEESFPEVLEARLREVTGRAVEVVNTGVGNTNTTMQVARFLGNGRGRDGLSLGPDLVVLAWFLNDPEDTPARTSSLVFEHSAAAVHFGAAMVRLVHRLGLGRGRSEDYYRALHEDGRPGYEAAKAALLKLAAALRERRVPLLLAVLPALHEVSPYPLAGVHAKLRDLAVEEAIPFVDLAPSVEGLDASTLWVSVEDPHPNALAHARFAALLLDPVRALLGPQVDRALMAPGARGAPPPAP